MVGRRGVGRIIASRKNSSRPVDGVGAVALLGAEALGVDHDHAVLGHALAGEPGEPRRCIVRQRDPAGVEAQLRGGRRAC